MVRSQEIPDCIKAIEPKYVTTSVIPYSSDKIFLPNEEALKDFESDITSQLNRFKMDSHITSHVIVYNFEGVISIAPVNTKAGMRYFFANLRNQREESRIQAYAIFDGLSAETTKSMSPSMSPWEEIERTLRGVNLSKPVVIARKQSRDMYSLLGNEGKVSRFLELWRALSEEKSWVNGGEFSRKHLNPTAAITLHDMNDLYGNGLALHANYEGTAYFRSVV